MDKQWVVYILRCRDGSLYTGITNDLTRRLEAHNSGTGAKYTRSHGPVKLVHLESVQDKNQALRRELEIKRLTRQEKLQLIQQE